MKPSSLLLLAIIGSLAGLFPARADDATVPGNGFEASRYADLWKKSPFAVATPEAAPDSPDYSLVGIANVEGKSYASVIDKKNQEHFLVSSDQPANGLTLVSITPGQNGGDTLAIVQRNGQPMTLKLEASVVTGGGAPVLMGSAVNAPAIPTGVGVNPPPINIPMPGAGTTDPRHPMFPRYRRPQIHLPPPPGSAPSAAPGQPQPPSTQPPSP